MTMNRRLTGWKLGLLLLIPLSVLAVAGWVTWNAFNSGTGSDIAIADITPEPTEISAQETPHSTIALPSADGNTQAVAEVLPTPELIPTPTALVLPTAVPLEPTPVPTAIPAPPVPTPIPVQPAPTTPPAPAAPAPAAPAAPAPAAPAQPATGTTGGTTGTDGGAGTDGTTDGEDESGIDPTVAAPPEGTQVHCSYSGVQIPERLAVGKSVGPLSVAVNPLSAEDLFDYKWDFGISEATGKSSGKVTFTKTGTYPIKVTATAKADGSVISSGCGLVEVFDPAGELTKISCATTPVDKKIKAADATLQTAMRTTVTWAPKSLKLNLEWSVNPNDPLQLIHQVSSPYSQHKVYGDKAARVQVRWVNPLDGTHGMLSCPIFPS